MLATSVLFTAMFSAVSIVWDREFGFLREMLVAPVRRGSIVVGKASAARRWPPSRALLVLALAGFVHVPYNPLMIVELIVELFLLSFTLTAFGLMMAARIQQMQTVHGAHADAAPAAVVPVGRAVPDHGTCPPGCR